MLKEVPVTAKMSKETRDKMTQDYLNYRKDEADKKQKQEQREFNSAIRNAQNKWGKGIGLGMTALADASILPSVARGFNAFHNTF